jgi:DNA-binding MarR family transcriptional regulator
MYLFNMNPSDVKHHGDVHELGRDPDGRLFSVGMRRLFAPLEIDMSAVEALSALRVAGKSLSLLQERWAEKHGLSEGRMGVLFRLFRQGSCPLGDLADAMDYTPRNITGLVDHLERDGLVERVPDPDDRRSVHARLTEAGRVRIKSIWKEGLEHQFEVVDGMTKDDLAQLRHLCLQLVENARKELGK